MDPLTIAMLALMAAGTGAQYMGQRKVDKERGKAMAMERERRGKLQAQNEASARATEEMFAKAKADEKAKAAELEAQYQKPVDAPVATGTPGEYQVYGAGTAPTGSVETVKSAEQSAARRKTYTDTLAKLKGQLGAFGGVMQDLNPGVMRNAQDIGLNSQSMINWNQNVLPLQLEAANQSGRDWSTAGDVMKLAAAVMSPWALTKGAVTGPAEISKAEALIPDTGGIGELASQSLGVPNFAGAVGGTGLVEQAPVLSDLDRIFKGMPRGMWPAWYKKQIAEREMTRPMY